ncbi:hypothetical protein AAMO2058_000298800 [Amorphochlora amoebiformis]|uniref:Importin N-terminal domain-containing protein n=1 Tax=Amorphochlora amoebiformis TaxID=1561963 RepID=A0A7S0GSH5_9EUKA|mmetsp:Transcript_15915/g.25188  ORF Transcript_15915/g.25188 Transcript_15915/m.25188 type:complete len:1067 (+) Transcript_15915:148-3348(+)
MARIPTKPEELQEVLLGMLDADNNRRKLAEQVLNAFFERPACVSALMQQVSMSPNARARQMAAVLLRKKLTAQLWRSNKSRKAIQQTLLERLVKEPVWAVRKAVAVLATRVAKLSVPDGQWPDLMPFLVQLVKKKDQKMRTVGMLMFRAMGENLGQEMVRSMRPFAQVVSEGLRDESMRVRAEAFRAMESIVSYLESKEHVAIYAKLIPIAVQSAQDILKGGDVDSSAPALELFNALTDSPVPVLEPYLVDLTKFMLEVAVKADVEMGISIADQAMSFVQSVVAEKPNRMLKAKLIPDLLKASFIFCVKPQDNPFDLDNITAQRIGIAMVTQLVESIPYKHILTPCLKTSLNLMQSKDNPHNRRGGLAIIAAMAEGFALLLSECLEQLLNACYALIKDQHPMVRAGACVCLLQLSDHISDVKEHHKRIVPSLVSVLDREGEHKLVRVKAAMALCAFIENLDPTEINLYINPLMTRFGNYLTNERESKEVREMSVGGIQSVASVAEEKFLPYFKPAAQVMFRLMEKKGDEDLKMRARATDCIGAIAAAVGAEAFEPLVEQILRIARENLTLELFELNEATFRLYSNLASCLGDKFIPILPEAFEYARKSVLSVDGVEFRHKGGDLSAFNYSDNINEEDFLKQMDYTIRSGAVDEKSTAIHALASYIENCQKGYLPFVEKTISLCEESLEYPHHFVRHGVAEVLTELCTLAHNLFPNPDPKTMNKHGQALVGRALALLLEMMKLEPDKGCCAAAVDGVKFCIEHFGIPILRVSGQKLIGLIEVLLKEKAPCQMYHGEEEDEKEHEADHDEILIDHVTDLLSSIAKITGPDFEPMFRVMLPHLLKFNQQRRAASDRIMAIGTIADVAEEMRWAIKPYLKVLFPQAIASLNDSEVGVRRNAAFATGIFALNGGEDGKAFYGQALEGLHKIISVDLKEKKGDPHWEACRDNAVSAISKMLAHDPKLATRQEVVDLFMAGLPLLDDMAEAKECYSRMSWMLAKLPTLTEKHRPHVLRVCAVALATHNVDIDVKQALAVLVRDLVKVLGREGCQRAAAGLTQEQKKALAEVAS